MTDSKSRIVLLNKFRILINSIIAELQANATGFSTVLIPPYAMDLANSLAASLGWSVAGIPTPFWRRGETLTIFSTGGGSIFLATILVNPVNKDELHTYITATAASLLLSWIVRVDMELAATDGVEPSITQAEFCRISGFSKSAVSRWCCEGVPMTAKEARRRKRSRDNVHVHPAVAISARARSRL